MIPQPRPRWAPSPSDAPSPPPPPPVPIAPTPRYSYLMGRLRSRQITMEEATELFEAQQQIVAAMSTPAAPAPVPTRPPPGPSRGLGVLPTDEAVAYGLVGLGAAAGLLAALLQKAQEQRAAPTRTGKSATR